MYGYIYKTTNLVDGKIYIGQKKSPKFLGKGYLGSGKVLKQAVSKYGEDNFKVELIEEIDCVEKMDEREIYWIAQYNATNREIGYNRSKGGNVNRTMVGENNPFYGKHHSEETRKKMSEHNSLYMLGKHHSEETKQKISDSNKGKYVSDETKKKLSENAKHNDNYGMKGKHHNDEVREKISSAKKGKPSHAKDSVHITNDVEDKMVHLEELDYYLSQGWRLGRKKFSKDACINISKGHRGQQAWNKNLKWVNKDGNKLLINENDLDNYLQDGWLLGMGKYKKD